MGVVHLFHIHVATEAENFPKDFYVSALDIDEAFQILLDRRGEIPDELLSWEEIDPYAWREARIAGAGEFIAGNAGTKQ